MAEKSTDVLSTTDKLLNTTSETNDVQQGG